MLNNSDFMSLITEPSHFMLFYWKQTLEPQQFEIQPFQFGHTLIILVALLLMSHMKDLT